MLRGWGIVIFLLFQAGMISSIPIPIQHGQEDTSKEAGNARGLISDFYTETMQKFPRQGSLSNEKKDFGDKFMETAVQSAITIGDLGIDTAKQVLDDIGYEFFQAIKM